MVIVWLLRPFIEALNQEKVANLVKINSLCEPHEGPTQADDAALIGGDSDGEEDNAEARIYSELLEEEQAKKRNAAFNALNTINTGQVGLTWMTLRCMQEERAESVAGKLPFCANDGRNVDACMLLSC